MTQRTKNKKLRKTTEKIAHDPYESSGPGEACGTMKPIPLDKSGGCASCAKKVGHERGCPIGSPPDIRKCIDIEALWAGKVTNDFRQELKALLSATVDLAKYEKMLGTKEARGRNRDYSRALGAFIMRWSPDAVFKQGLGIHDAAKTDPGSQGRKDKLPPLSRAIDILSGIANAGQISPNRALQTAMTALPLLIQGRADRALLLDQVANLARDRDKLALELAQVVEERDRAKEGIGQFQETPRYRETLAKLSAQVDRSDVILRALYRVSNSGTYDERARAALRAKGWL